MHWLDSSSTAIIIRFQTWFGRMFAYSETFWREICYWRENLIKSHTLNQNYLTEKNEKCIYYLGYLDAKGLII